MSNSIGNLKNSGLQGNNFPWQLKMLQGLQAIYDEVKLPLTCAEDSVTICSPAGGLDVNLHDGAGTAITSTTIGADTGVDVNIIGGVTLEVNLDAANDQVGIYGYTNPADPSTYTGIKTDASGVLAIQDNGGSITVDATSLPLPTGAATEATLLLVNNNLSSASRTPGIKTYVNAVGSTTAGIYSFSIANVGSASGLVDGEVLPAGVTVNFDGGAMNNTLTAMAFDATGTTFVVTTIS